MADIDLLVCVTCKTTAWDGGETRPGRQLADDLAAHSAEGRELYAWMGDRLGTIVPG